MKIGAMNDPRCDPVAEIEWFGQHGFDFVDLTMDPPTADSAVVDVRAVRAALDRYNLGMVGGVTNLQSLIIMCRLQ